MSLPDQKYLAQACITSIGFPDTVVGLREMIAGNKNAGSELTDLDCLLQFRPDEPTFWTAPKWLTHNDVLFFYQTKRGALNAARLRNLAKIQFPRARKLHVVVERAAELSKRLAGTIFGCASVAGPTEYLGPPEKHFKGRIYAPLGKVHIFKNPLSADIFARFVRITQNTITPLYSREATGIRSQLEIENRLPRFLSKIEFGDQTFRNVNRHNWTDISCRPSTRFICEAQIRSYLIDFFLAKIKDKGSMLLEECRCFRDGVSTGIVDNFVKIDGVWIPCEAKLNVRSEKDIFGQVAKYSGIDEFVPTKGRRTGDRFKAAKSNICLVVDQAGLYLIPAEGRISERCEPKLLIKREHLGDIDVVGLRKLIEKYL